MCTIDVHTTNTDRGNRVTQQTGRGQESPHTRTAGGGDTVQFHYLKNEKLKLTFKIMKTTASQEVTSCLYVGDQCYSCGLFGNLRDITMRSSSWCTDQTYATDWPIAADLRVSERLQVTIKNPNHPCCQLNTVDNLRLQSLKYVFCVTGSRSPHFNLVEFKPAIHWYQEFLAEPIISVSTSLPMTLDFKKVQTLRSLAQIVW